MLEDIILHLDAIQLSPEELAIYLVDFSQRWLEDSAILHPVVDHSLVQDIVILVQEITQ